MDPPTPHTFVGRQGYYRDEELDLYYVRARYYDPATAHWLSEDPKHFAAGEANLYRYVGNNPVGAIDPSGLDGFSTQPTNIGGNDDRRSRRTMRDVIIADARLRMVIAYSNGVVHGPYTDFWSDGRAASVGHYENDYQEGLWHFFNKDGTLRESIRFLHGKELPPC